MLKIKQGEEQDEDDFETRSIPLPNLIKTRSVATPNNSKRIEEPQLVIHLDN